MHLLNSLQRHSPELRQAARVLVGTTVAFLAIRILDLPQGYWAVFTVMVVLQGSIASTLSAAIDRLFGTIVGALVGSAGVAAIRHGVLDVGAALTVIVGGTALAAALRPELKIAPVTAALILLTEPTGGRNYTFVLHRVIEIGIGGLIGVVTSVIVFPARSRPLVLERSSAALGHIQQILAALAASIEKPGHAPVSEVHVLLRGVLNSVEQATLDAERERASGLAHGPATPLIGRALWRIRNDLVLLARAVDRPLPGAAQPVIATSAAEFLRTAANYAERCASCLRNEAEVPPFEAEEKYQTFESAFSSLKRDGVLHSLEFVDARQIFGLAFAIEILSRDLREFSEVLAGPE